MFIQRKRNMNSVKPLAIGSVFGVVFLFMCTVKTTDAIEKKYGCVLPEQPWYGSFVFNDRRKSMKYKCDEGYILTGSYRVKDRKCRRGKWTGEDRDCINLDAFHPKCPKLLKPNNGDVIVEGREVGKKAYFSCNEGFVIEGSSVVTCQAGHRWDGILPVCHSRRTIEDLADHLKDKMIDRLAGATTNSKTGAQARLSPGKSGLDIVLLVDTSSSIGASSLISAKKFMKLLVDIFGVSNQTSGGKNGTRFALITFSGSAKVEFNLDDPNARSKEAVMAEIDKIQNTGGGTNFRDALTKVASAVYVPKLVLSKNTERFNHATRAVFLITDAEVTSSLNANRMDRIKEAAAFLKTDGKFELFSIGVGQNIDKFVLEEIASTPHIEHVFLLSQFKDLDKVADIIAERNIDYGQCGISGNIEIAQGRTEAEKGAWPWLGWLSVIGKGIVPQTCGGALLCDRWFMTAASCVSKVENGTVVPFDISQINLHLSDHKLYKKDLEEVWPRVEAILIHDNYTGEEIADLKIRENDVALLDLGKENKTRPVFNKYLRPLCFAADNESSKVADTQLKGMLSLPDSFRGFTAGWGNAPDNSKYMELLSSSLQQTQRPLQKRKACKGRYPAIDLDKFFCVGSDFPEHESCNGDIGGPYMVQLSTKRYYNFGLALNTRDCHKRYKFSIFLNLIHPSITQWVEPILDGCNRVESIEE